MLCKMAGVPEFIWSNHSTRNCRKSDEYARLMSGGVGQRKKAKDEAKQIGKQFRREFKMMAKKIRRLESKSLSKRSKVEDVESEFSEMSDSS